MFDMIPFGRRDNDLFRMLDNMEKSFFGGMDFGVSSFRTDIKEEKDNYILEAELPGFQKEEIHVDIDGDYLTISAEHNEDVEQKQDNYVCRERRYGSFHRSFSIANVKEDEIKADYHDGVLKLVMPKRAETKRIGRRIDIG